MNLAELAICILGFAVFLAATQDLHIFPGAFLSKLNYFQQRRKTPPPRVESIFIPSTDGTRLELWRYAAEQQTVLSDHVALIFHGNGGPVENFVFVQYWLAALGISSYSFDYRGFGRSGGWPSEKGFYRDSDVFWSYAAAREQAAPSKLLVVGISIGSAPAARIAALHQPKMLLLCSAFTDLKSAVRAQKGLGFLAPFIWHRFPTLEFVRQLSSTHLLLAHGRRDNIVPVKHSELLEQAYGGTGRVRRLAAEDAGHNGAFFALKDELGALMVEWLAGGEGSCGEWVDLWANSGGV